LIAGDRSFSPIGTNSLLFEVLNQIDGLDGDIDVTFLLTTNRVDILERALSERPGRVDVAVEIAPPDAEGRRRLLDLYGSKLGLPQLTEEEARPAIELTEGRTATFMREVVRRASLIALAGPSSAELRVSGEILLQAAQALTTDRAELTRSITNGVTEPDAEPPIGFPARERWASGSGYIRHSGAGIARPFDGNETLPFGGEG
jgi:ATP-dependent 26S proteasome regulatory subunit